MEKKSDMNRDKITETSEIVRCELEKRRERERGKSMIENNTVIERMIE